MKSLIKINKEPLRENIKARLDDIVKAREVRIKETVQSNQRRKFFVGRKETFTETLQRLRSGDFTSFLVDETRMFQNSEQKLLTLLRAVDNIGTQEIFLTLEDYQLVFEKDLLEEFMYD